MTVSVDRREVKEVRLYFKPMTATDFVYLDMAPSGENHFSAQLPPTRRDAKGLDYLLLFSNDRGESRKTKPFRLLILKGHPEGVSTKEPIKVFWEQDAAPVFDKAFAAPLLPLPSPSPRLAEAKEDAYPSLVPESSSAPSLGPLSGPGGFFFSIKIGGFGLFYGGR